MFMIFMPSWPIAAYMLILCQGPGPMYWGLDVIGPSAVVFAPRVFRATWYQYQMTIRIPIIAPAVVFRLAY